ncbi:hypothetical protein Anas_14395 [Armadillidium nasatum]|uniref:Uncharacterized protein n=1 Tax=Armadillidium nasatum TaxID=96803 RepID=A0A5N5SM59_9CRUS|nr:hypothetical protein Anas_14395 [Armadillidium nasatum]
MMERIKDKTCFKKCLSGKFRRIPRMSVTISRKPRETFPNFFEHATICNFAEERPLNIAQILT